MNLETAASKWHSSHISEKGLQLHAYEAMTPFMIWKWVKLKIRAPNSRFPVISEHVFNSTCLTQLLGAVPAHESEQNPESYSFFLLFTDIQEISCPAKSALIIQMHNIPGYEHNIGLALQAGQHSVCITLFPFWMKRDNNTTQSPMLVNCTYMAKVSKIRSLWWQL